MNVPEILTGQTSFCVVNEMLCFICQQVIKAPLHLEAVEAFMSVALAADILHIPGCILQLCVYFSM